MRNWEGLAKTDALWSVCTHPGMKGGKWDEKGFFNSGKQETERLFAFLAGHGIHPSQDVKALDFGCGPGRLTRALCPRFSSVTGVDVSETMIRKAVEMNNDYLDRITFHHHPRPGLDLFPDSEFGFILSFIVFQHIPAADGYHTMEELFRILAPGGWLVVQLPVADLRRPSLWLRFRSKLRLREKMALLGLGKGYQMEMHIYNESWIKELARKAGLENMLRAHTNQTNPSYAGNLQFISPEESRDFISLLLVFRKQDSRI